MKMRNINLALFSFFLVVLISHPIFFADYEKSQPNAPWHLLPFHADSLSQQYKINYHIMEQHALVTHLADSAQKKVMVLVDGWGIPYDEDMLKQDFALFNRANAEFAIHKRLLGHTSHAENVEYRKGFADGIFIIQGDSSACEKKTSLTYWDFRQNYCCANCNDSKMISIIDSLLSDSNQVKIGWTVRSTREGDRETLHEVLRGLSDVASRHPDVQFIIQGTHRPILGTPETRRKYLAPWVPAVFLNAKIYIPEKK